MELQCAFGRNGVVMLIADVLRTKPAGRQVGTVTPDATVSQLLDVLDAQSVGAMVVSSDGVEVDGIVSERDVVRALRSDGPDLLERPVRDIMTVASDMLTTTEDVSVEQAMRVMGDRDIRHVPVLAGGRLAGIVSIGDLVRNRISEMASERSVLVGYISSGV